MEILYIAALTVLAAGVGTLTGFGTSTIMVPVLLLWLPLPQTLLLVGVIHWFGNVWKMSMFRQGLNWRLIMLFGLPGVVMTFIGARLIFSVPEELLSRILGAFLIGYVVFLLIKPRFKLSQRNTTAVVGGGLSGFLAGIFGVGGAVRGAFLSMFDLKKSVYIATAGAIGLAVDSVRLTTYFSQGTRLEPEMLLGLLAFIPASLLGAWLAKSVVKRIPQSSFRAVVAIFLLIAGLKLLVFP